jgi:hypothetical protein
LPNLRNAWFERECVVADAVDIEPVSSLLAGRFRRFAGRYSLLGL